MSLRGPRLARRTLFAGGLAVTAVGAVGVPAALASRSAAAPSLVAPSISSTADWEARDPNGSIEVLDTAPNKIIVHHTATENSEDTSQEHAYALSRQIQDFHMDSNGWIDTGQNFTNSRGGHLTEGRHQSLDALQGGSRHVLGAHSGEQNSVALGIENEGSYTETDVPEALWNALVELCAYMVSQYGIDPGEIYGHRDFMATECPGEVLCGRLGELREAVGAATRRAVVHPVVWPLLTARSAGPSVTAFQHLLRAQGAESVPVDGVFGAATQAAGGEFLDARGLRSPSCYATRVREDGVFGGMAWTWLAPVLTPESRGEAVLAAQALLTSKGHHAPPEARVGARTASAVREFQAARGLRVSGAVDHETWKRLLA